MQTNASQLNVMIAHGEPQGWASVLADRLARLPVHTHWTRSGEEAFGLAATCSLHLGVVGAQLPDGDGLSLLRRFRRIGLAFPCLLVCNQPDPRLLHDALAAAVFSVVRSEDNRDVIAPHVLKVVRQVYGLDWTNDSPLN